MTLIIETGGANPNAESYISVADADAYHTDHGDPSAWSGATLSAKEAALREATQYLDGAYAMRWMGVRVTNDQALDWPRINVMTTPNDYEFAANEVPLKIRQACAELALLSITETSGLMPSVDDTSRIESERNKVGDLETSVKYIGGASGLKRFSKPDFLVRRYLRSTTRLDRA